MERNRLTYSYSDRLAKSTNDWQDFPRADRVISLRLSPGREVNVAPRPVYDSILVPLDGTPFAEHAIPYALGFAERAGATLNLVHVHFPFEGMDEFAPLYMDYASIRSLERRKESYLNDVRQRISKVSSVRVAPHIVTGYDVPSSLRVFGRFQADLIVMATHARGPIARFWSGSVARQVLSQAKTPVMLVRGDDTSPEFTVKRIRHILVPLDGTSTAEQVLEPVVTLSRMVHAKQTLMQAVPLAAEYQIRYGQMRTAWIPSDRHRSRSWRYLEGIASKLRRRFLDVNTEVVSGDDPVPEMIAHYAEDCGADLIAITSTTRGRISRMFRRSTPDWLIRKATVPVLVVPAQHPVAVESIN